MFPSPIGELQFSIAGTFIRTSTGYKCFRPLSGSYISQSFARTYTSLVLEFPSPIGELHFSMLAGKYVNIPIWFPSPIGELHFSMKKYNLSNIMKSFRPLSGSYISQLNWAKCIDLLHESFRPLSGSYISQSSHTAFYTCVGQFPSPIGELHFSIDMSELLKKQKFGFPSPIGELHFSMVKKQWQECLRLVSVPYRGATFLNTIPATPCSVWDR